MSVSDKDNLVRSILMRMEGELSVEQLESLNRCLSFTMYDYSIRQEETAIVVSDDSNNDVNAFKMFFIAKKMEGCADSTLYAYRDTVTKLLTFLGKPLATITTDDIRYYLAITQSRNNCSNVTLDNYRRYLCSFFTWLLIEDYITINPMLKIRKIKTDYHIKKAFSEYDLELLRDACEDARDRALVEVLLSTGIRARELCSLNRNDIPVGGNEIIVLGKGGKERIVYLNSRALFALGKYLGSRKDKSDALFVGQGTARLAIESLRHVLRAIGDRAGVTNVHPHRFRRTAATIASDRGMPIEQVQKLLGHAKLDTTMIYVSASQKAVKQSHERFLTG